MAEKPFNKPLDQWIEEKEVVDQINVDFDPATGKIKTSTSKVEHPVQVRYERSRVEMTFCPDLQHSWHVVDPHNYMVKCRKCPMMKKIMPGLEFIDPEGHIRLRSNDTVIA